MATAPAAPTSALIEALRGSSAPGLPNPGIRFYDNPQSGPALAPFTRQKFPAYVPPAPRPSVIAPPLPSTPSPSGGGVVGGGGTTPPKFDHGERRTIIKPKVTTESGFVAPNLPDFPDLPDVPDVPDVTLDTPVIQTNLDVVSPGTTTTNLKTDASYWGDGIEDLVADDGDGTFGVLMSDQDPPPVRNFPRPDDGLGSFGVLLSDMDDDTLGSVDDVNGSDLQSDQYTFGVLMSDQDPKRQEIVDINKLIDEWDMFAFAKEAERKLREKFDTPEDMER